MPHVAAEQAGPVRLVHGLGAAVRLAQQQHVLRSHPGVVRVRVPGPAEEPRAAPVVGVGAAVLGALRERLRRVVRHEHRGAARPAVRERRLDRRGEILLGQQVADRVVHEHRVERAAQPQVAHVALDVRALRVQRARHRQHARRQVGQRHREPALQVDGVVPAAAAQLEHLADVEVGGIERGRDDGGLVGVVVRR
nr:hypothetical protein [Jiangella muralis]